MGFRQAAVLVPVCFFLGILFICFNVDHRLLWGNRNDEDLADGFKFYTTFYNAPPAIKALLHGMIGVGLVGLVTKLHRWDESAMFFDGSSLCVYVFAIAVYITVIIPMLGTTVNPADVDTKADSIEAMRVLSAANVIVIICLGAILTLQAGQVYARRSEDEEQNQLAAKKQQ
ncbi:secretory component protein [Moniliophthora roreri MCA 2997]|uniref:Secretory component protein n=2 Tax=Moniliophthora roreri TaxID=221103 RepID=V2XLE6_MONRO|nr:secretory component protein [Moniliophthora roreri MCA 2997]KAI3604188.1 secretory component protein [Moniliophthora roreri]